MFKIVLQILIITINKLKIIKNLAAAKIRNKNCKDHNS